MVCWEYFDVMSGALLQLLSHDNKTDQFLRAIF